MREVPHILDVPVHDFVQYAEIRLRVMIFPEKLRDSKGGGAGLDRGDGDQVPPDTPGCEPAAGAIDGALRSDRSSRLA